MNLVFEKLSQALAAGIKWDIGIAGAYLRLSACQWPCTVLLYKQGRIIGQMNNMLAGDYVEGVDFDGIGILNGATAQAIDVQISGGGAGSNRVLGEVSVIDGGRARTAAGVAFSGYASQVAAGAMYSYVQLWNPVGSGVVLVVESIDSGSSVATGAYVAGNAAALSTLVGAAKSKKIGGSGSVAQIRKEATASELVSANALMVKVGPVMVSKVFAPKEPILIGAGAGLLVGAYTLNADVFGFFEFFEEQV